MCSVGTESGLCIYSFDLTNNFHPLEFDEKCITYVRKSQLPVPNI